jgi:molybdopterin molybdotransferase
MLSVEEARDRLLAAAQPLAERETLPTLEASGRVLAAPVVAAIDVPPMDNSQMDGYALRCVDVVAAGAVLPVSQRIAAGHVGAPLAPGTVARIFTGASVPAGADAIVMQENVVACGESVAVNEVPQPGQWIRRAGLDVRAGAQVLGAGTLLRAAQLGLAASVGCAALEVVRRLRVAVFFTGDELVMPGEPLPPGAIYNSNRFVLRGLLARLGCEVSDFGIVPDALDATRAVLRRAASGHDLILTSGGVSVGEEDHMRPAVQAEGTLDLWKIAIKPGKPLAFGRVGVAAFIGLPGNPVSSFLTFLLLVRPFVLAQQGAAARAPAACSVRADFDWPKPDARREFLRVRRNAEGGLDLFPNQSSGVLTSTVWGDGVVDNAPGQVIRRGDAVRFLAFSEMLS